MGHAGDHRSRRRRWRRWHPGGERCRASAGLWLDHSVTALVRDELGVIADHYGEA